MEQIKEEFNRVHDKLDKLDNRMDKIDLTQVAILKDLKYHIKRTNLLENELHPIKNRYQQLIGVLKLAGWVAACSAIIEVVLRIY